MLYILLVNSNYTMKDTLKKITMKELLSILLQQRITSIKTLDFCVKTLHNLLNFSYKNH